MTLALDYGRRAERQRPEEPDVDPQVRFCERGRSRERSLLDPGVTCTQIERARSSHPRIASQQTNVPRQRARAGTTYRRLLEHERPATEPPDAWRRDDGLPGSS